MWIDYSREMRVRGAFKIVNKVEVPYDTIFSLVQCTGTRVHDKQFLRNKLRGTSIIFCAIVVGKRN